MVMTIPNEVEISGMDRAKDLIKRALWNLPTPLSVMAFKLGCNAGLFNKYFLIYEKLGRPPKVLSGPFQGMSFLPLARGSTPIPKVLGTYEKELHPIVERLAREPCDVLVDVGSAEGYYAVGLSRMLGVSKVCCFDLDLLSKRLLMRMARANNVADRIVLGGFCRPQDLQAIMETSTHPLVICDCEGGEMDLLDPQAAPGLSKARVLVEVHDFHGTPLIEDELTRRFAATHEIEIIRVEPRRLTDLPDACRAILTEQEGLAALSEARGEVPGWLYFRPTAGQPA
jgi:hypothetical protein